MLRTLKRITLCVLLAALTLFTIEVGCRALEPGPLRLRDEFPYIADQVLGQLHKPSSDKSWRGSHFGINAQGFRGPELKSSSSPKLFRILCIGDSLTFGTGVEEADTWPRQLEALLRERVKERDVEVVNLSVEGWSSAQYRDAWARFGPELVPDLVIFGWSVNDLPGTSVHLRAHAYPDSPPAQDSLSKLKPAAMMRHFSSEWTHRRREERWEELRDELTLALGPWRQNATPSIREELAPLVEEVRASGAKPVLLSFPYEFQLRSAAADLAPAGTLKMCCSGLDVPFLSMATTYRAYIQMESPGLAPLFQRGTLCQPTETGHEMVAESVLRLLEHEALLP
jgi:lysophospholipase L1-like esterase